MTRSRAPHRRARSRSPVGTPVVDAIGTDGGTVVGANGGNKDVDFSSFTPASDGLLDLSVTPATSGFQTVLAMWDYDPNQHTIVKLGEVGGAAPRLIRQ